MPRIVLKELNLVIVGVSFAKSRPRHLCCILSAGCKPAIFGSAFAECHVMIYDF